MAMTYELCPWLVYLNLDYIETGISNLDFIVVRIFLDTLN